MTHRLLVNPDTPQQWEILLPRGTIRIGRHDDNDHQIEHPSVSGTHCEIVVDETGVRVRDLGSTNGTFINRTPVQEAVLAPGQHLQLGKVNLRFELVAAPGTIIIPPAPISPPPPVRITLPRPAQAEVQSAPSPTAREEPPEPPIAPLLTAPAAVANPGDLFCQSHPRTLARFYCAKCRNYFCELCVTTRATASGAGKVCRTCGVPMTALHVKAVRSPRRKSFYAQLPGAFGYPFKGFGVAIMLLAALLFGGVQYLVNLGFLFGPFWWAIRIMVYGLLFLFMQNIIFITTSDENEPMGFPDANELFGAAFQLSCTILISFGLAFGLMLARLFEADIPTSAIVAAGALGCLYFPMAFLAVAMKDTALAANPLIVIPTILRLPVEYFATTILTMTIFGLRLWGNQLSSEASGSAITTRHMSTLFTSLGIQAAWAFLSVYLLCVNMRILGLLYNAKRERFGWFSR